MWKIRMWFDLNERQTRNIPKQTDTRVRQIDLTLTLYLHPRWTSPSRAKVRCKERSVWETYLWWGEGWGRREMWGGSWLLNLQRGTSLFRSRNPKTFSSQTLFIPYPFKTLFSQNQHNSFQNKENECHGFSSVKVIHSTEFSLTPRWRPCVLCN